MIQRVTSASVSIEGETVGSIGPGLLVLLGVANGDTEDDAKYLVEKVANLRIFADLTNRFNRSARDTGAELLIVSQFTLYADTHKGRRPDFNQAASATEAQRLYEHAVDLFRRTELKVETGQFQAYMQVNLWNDGPGTLMLDSADRNRPRH